MGLVLSGASLSPTAGSSTVITSMWFQPTSRYITCYMNGNLYMRESWDNGTTWATRKQIPCSSTWGQYYSVSAKLNDWRYLIWYIDGSNLLATNQIGAYPNPWPEDDLDWHSTINPLSRPNGSSTPNASGHFLQATSVTNGATWCFYPGEDGGSGRVLRATFVDTDTGAYDPPWIPDTRAAESLIVAVNPMNSGQFFMLVDVGGAYEVDLYGFGNKNDFMTVPGSSWAGDAVATGKLFRTASYSYLPASLVCPNRYCYAVRDGDGKPALILGDESFNPAAAIVLGVSDATPVTLPNTLSVAAYCPYGHWLYILYVEHRGSNSAIVYRYKTVSGWSTPQDLVMHANRRIMRMHTYTYNRGTWSGDTGPDESLHVAYDVENLDGSADGVYYAQMGHADPTPTAVRKNMVFT